MAQLLSYDYVVVGSGLSGLFTAAHLSRQSAKVLLVDDGEHTGGSHRSIETDFGTINHTLQFFPWTQTSPELFEDLEGFLGLKLINKICDHQPLTFEKGDLSPFIGFGKEAPPFFAEMAPFLSSQQAVLNLEWGVVIQLLREKFTGDLVQKNILTGFEYVNDQISHVVINGSKKIQVSQVVFCGNLKRLSSLLHLHPGISSRMKTKLSKGPYWTSLRLDLIFRDHVTSADSIHVLMGASQDDVSPCYGRFQNPFTKTSGDTQLSPQISQWITHLPALEAEESETVGEAIKKIKRQVKRAYFGSLDPSEFQKKITRERITFLDYNLGSDLKLEKNCQISDIPNLWVGSSQLHTERGPLAGLAQSRVLLKEFGMSHSKLSPELAPG